jgi:hypothetical protein
MSNEHIHNFQLIPVRHSVGFHDFFDFLCECGTGKRVELYAQEANVRETIARDQTDRLLRSND